MECDVVCEQAKVLDGQEDLTAAAEGVNRVLGTMEKELLGCYQSRLKAHPHAHAFMTIDIVVGPDGKVRDVQTTGGALLGDEAIACLVRHVREARFEPPRGGGTMRVQVPFTLRRVAPEGA